MELKIIAYSLVIIPILGILTHLNIYEIGAIYSVSALTLASLLPRLKESK